MNRSALTLGAALGAGLAAALLVACAGARSPAMRSPASEAAPMPATADPHARIRELDAEIARQLAGAGLAAPDAAAAQSAAALPMLELHPTCTRSPRDLCQDACKLGDSICDNATTICDLAGQLAGDAWAAERCDHAKAACQRAADRCCHC